VQIIAVQVVPGQCVAVKFVAVQLVAVQCVAVQCVTVQLTELPQKLLMLRWGSFSEGSCDIFHSNFACTGGRCFYYLSTPWHSSLIIHDAR
jgi:hypothetical protein